VSGVTLAKRITLDLNELNASVWTLWQTADLDNSLTTSSGWGLTAASFCGCTGGASCECRPDNPKCDALRDTWRPSWSHDPHAACEQWSSNSDWGALAHGHSLAQACAGGWAKTNCAKTCCEALSSSEATSSEATGGSGGSYAIRKSFYTYKHFTAFIRPGSTIVAPPTAADNTEGEPALLAAIDPRGRGILIFTNERNASADVNHALRGLPVTDGEDGELCATWHITDAARNCERLPDEMRLSSDGDGEAEGGLALRATLPPRSVSTFVLDRCLEQSPRASPTVADPSDGSHTICAVRQLAYERALAIQPHNAPLLSLFDALQLHTLCGMPRPAEPMPKAAPSRGPAEVLESLRVDPALGDDRRGRPFRSISAAVRAARQRKIKSIVLSDGIHFLNETLILTPADSGFSITAASGATNAWISGGVPLTGLSWKAEGNGVYAATITDPAVEDIPGLLTVGDDHSPTSRLVRARYPNGDWELDQCKSLLVQKNALLLCCADWACPDRGLVLDESVPRHRARLHDP